MSEDRFNHLVRQWDVIPCNVLDQEIHVIGAGAIGSFTVLALAKMGFGNITVYDDDTVDLENMNCQFFRFSDIGKLKVEALQDLVRDFTGIEIEAHNERYESGQLRGIVISAVDNMAVRKNIWDNHKEFAIGTQMIIDPRMAAEHVACYAMRPLDDADIKSYEKTLYSDEDAVHERCTAKSTMYTVLSISSHVAKVIKDFLARDDNNYCRILQWNIKENAQQTWWKNQ